MRSATNHRRLNGDKHELLRQLALAQHQANMTMVRRGIRVGAFAKVGEETDQDAKMISKISGILVRRHGDKKNHDYRTIIIVEAPNGQGTPYRGRERGIQERRRHRD